VLRKIRGYVLYLSEVTSKKTTTEYQRLNRAKLRKAGKYIRATRVGVTCRAAGEPRLVRNSAIHRILGRHFDFTTTSPPTLLCPAIPQLHWQTSPGLHETLRFPMLLNAIALSPSHFLFVIGGSPCSRVGPVGGHSERVQTWRAGMADGRGEEAGKVGG
jgi:hypothetical protein